MSPDREQNEARELRSELHELRKDVGALAPVPAILSRIEDRLGDLDERFRAKEIADASRSAQVEAHIEGVNGRVKGAFSEIGSLGQELTAHKESHWKWIVATTSVVIAVLSVIIGLANWMNRTATDTRAQDLRADSPVAVRAAGRQVKAYTPGGG